MASISGLYEVCIGVKDTIPETQYWEFFVCRIGETGRLSAEQANVLYGVDSRLQSIRLCHLDRSRPGALGMSLYTYRVVDIGDYHKKVTESAATMVKNVTENEFGEPSFSFIPPDGTFWTLVGLK